MATRSRIEFPRCHEVMDTGQRLGGQYRPLRCEQCVTRFSWYYGLE